MVHSLLSANEDTNLDEIEDIFSKLEIAGISLPLTLSNRQAIIQQLAVHDVILKRLASIQAIKAGMDEVNIIQLACKHQQIKSALVIKDKPLDTDSFLSLFSIPKFLSENQQ